MIIRKTERQKTKKVGYYSKETYWVVTVWFLFIPIYQNKELTHKS